MYMLAMRPLWASVDSHNLREATAPVSEVPKDGLESERD